ncbi:hypothetical protein DB346_02510 [Verrucomicrobia bacterium LW23]|nr:hypothetical protein DB346_04145 [Verrucomicrobia bacterium LW23]PTY04321.1 hypothetical protein DB346_02510 [Verrucomicrobia bacterium LW23]
MILEARRDVRTSLFVLIFLGLHLLLIASLIVSFMVDEFLDTLGFHYLLRSVAAELGDAAFWIAAVPVLLVALPFSALFALTGDIRTRSLEVILLTRLGPLGIVAGKWSGYALQALLLACTMSPYLCLRYMLMGTNPVVESVALVALAAAATAVCAAGVAISAIPSIVLRLLLAVLVAILLGWATCIGIGAIIVWNASGSWEELFFTSTGVLLPATPAMLGFAAASIAGPSYRGAWIPRVATLATTLFFGAAVVYRSEAFVVMSVQVIFGLLVMLPMMLEDVVSAWNGSTPLQRGRGHGGDDTPASGRMPTQLPTPMVVAALSTSPWRRLMSWPLLPGWQGATPWVVATLTIWSLSATLPYLQFSHGSIWNTASLRLEEYSLGAIPVAAGAFCFYFLLIYVLNVAKERVGWGRMSMAQAVLGLVLFTAIFSGVATILEALDRAWFIGNFGVYAYPVPPLQLASIFIRESAADEAYVAYLAMWPLPVLLLLAVREHYRLLGLAGSVPKAAANPPQSAASAPAAPLPAAGTSTTA